MESHQHLPELPEHLRSVYGDILINESIPATMDMEGLCYLGKLAKAVPEGGTIVEVGPLFGSSTWVLSKNAHPSVKIVSIDTWEPAEWIDRRFPDGPEFSLATFKRMVADCPNVTPIQGWSPQVVSDWSKPIDLFFDDATHGDPGFSENLKFFQPFMHKNSILCGDDFAGGWPDIVRIISDLGESLGQPVEVTGRVWSLLCNGSAPVSSRLGRWSGCELKTATTSRKGISSLGQPYMWAGNLHRRLPMRSLRSWVTSGSENNVPFNYQVQDRDGSESKITAAGDKVSAPHYIRNIRFSLDDEFCKAWSINYRLCWFRERPRRCSVSSWFGNNTWPNLPEDARVVALQVNISNR